jgi:hypothetical protein
MTNATAGLAAAAALAACGPVSGASGCDEPLARVRVLAAGLAEDEEEALCGDPEAGLGGP